MVIVVEALVALSALEIGQDVAITPPLASRFCPGIIVGGIAPGIDLGVDGAASAHHLGLGVPKLSVVHILLWHGGPAPAGDAFGHLCETGRPTEQKAVVRTSSFDDQHLYVRIFG